MTIQSTCHPHSQAASSSLLANEGGGVGEADMGGDGGGGQTQTQERREREGSREVWVGQEPTQSPVQVRGQEEEEAKAAGGTASKGQLSPARGAT